MIQSVNSVTPIREQKRHEISKGALYGAVTGGVMCGGTMALNKVLEKRLSKDIKAGSTIFKYYRNALASSKKFMPAAILSTIASCTLLGAAIGGIAKVLKRGNADNSGCSKNSPEVDRFMQKTMDDIAISQMEVKLDILKDKITAYDTTPAQRRAMKQEFDATKKELDETKQKNGIA